MLEGLINTMGKEKVEQDKKYGCCRRVQWGHFPVLNGVLREGIAEWCHLDKEGAGLKPFAYLRTLRQESVPGVVEEEWGSQCGWKSK